MIHILYTLKKICGKNVNQDLTYQYTAGGTLLQIHVNLFLNLPRIYRINLMIVFYCFPHCYSKILIIQTEPNPKLYFFANLSKYFILSGSRLMNQSLLRRMLILNRRLRRDLRMTTRPDRRPPSGQYNVYINTFIPGFF